MQNSLSPSIRHHRDRLVALLASGRQVHVGTSNTSRPRLRLDLEAADFFFQICFTIFSSSSACSTIDDTLLLFISFLPLSSRCVLASLWCSLYFNLTAACSVPLRACTTLWARLSCTRLCSTNFVTFSDLEYVTFLAE